MEFNRRIYRLSPRNYSAETIAVTFAKTSRSPEPFDEIAAELNEEKAPNSAKSGSLAMDIPV